MKHLVIVGAGGFGRELFGIARESIGYGVDFDVKGFLDVRSDALCGFENYPKVVGSPEDYEPEENDVFITALGSIAARRHCVEVLRGRGAKFISLIHRTASVAQGVTIGEGSLVAQFAVVSADAKIGRHSCVFQNSVIGHDCRIGDWAHVYSLCALGGGVVVEDGAVVYPGSRIVPHRRIGAGAVVGIGSVVMLNVNGGETVFGNPAQSRPAP